MVESAEISYDFDEEEGSLKIYNIPEGKEVIEVHLRSLTRRDRTVIREIQGDPNALEKTLALVITKWGDREGITSLELLQPKRDRACMILQAAYDKFFSANFRFAPREPSGMVENSISAE
jgi:hypothetical protein